MNVEYTESVWNGYRMLEFTFQQKDAKLVIPKTPSEHKNWLFKTEYFGAFPDFELEMLSRGYYVANIQNTTRWCLEEDTARQAEFARFLHDEFGLNKRCVPIGMSCGGMQAVYLSAKHPELVKGLYLDAPVLNLLSCPCGIGKATNALYDEFVSATGKTVSDLINYRKHPIDFAEALVKNNLPVFLVCGDIDDTVPYEENGKQLFDYYTEHNAKITQVVKKNCNHHPHGLEDMKPLIDFVTGLE